MLKPLEIEDSSVSKVTELLLKSTCPHDLNRVGWSRETVGTTAFPELKYGLPTHFLHPDFGIHPTQNRSGTGYWGSLKSLKVLYLHNDPDNSKSSCPQGHVGSNPTRCAKMC